jgi:lipoprotein-releasing system permease protein
VFELFVARRYLRAKRKQVVISVITAISVIGVAVGVMAMVIALAVTNGFRSTLEKNLLGATAAVSIQEKEPGNGIEGWEQISKKLASLPHVTSAMPGLYDTALIGGPITSGGAVVKGILVRPGDPLPEALRHMKTGSVDALRSDEGLPSIILGSRLADLIGARVNKQVTLIIPNGEMTPLGNLPKLQRCLLAGTVETGFYEVDIRWAYMSLGAAQKAFELQDVVNSIELRLDDIFLAPEVAREAEKVIGPKLAAITWQDQNREIFNALKTERVGTVITIGLIQLVAALNILITLVMMVMEKHRDIAGNSSSKRSAPKPRAGRASRKTR